MIDYVWYGAVVDNDYINEYFIPTSARPCETDTAVLKEMGLKATIDLMPITGEEINKLHPSRSGYVGIGGDDEGHFALGMFQGVLWYDNDCRKMIFSIPIAVKDFQKASELIHKYTTWEYHLLID